MSVPYHALLPHRASLCLTLPYHALTVPQHAFTVLCLTLPRYQGVVFGPSWTSLKAAIMERSNTDASHLRTAASPGESGFDWTGRVVLVTGCGKALGNEFASQLIQSKAHVIAG